MSLVISSRLPVVYFSNYFPDLCPKPNDTKNSLSKQSHYEQLEGIPGLFNALLEDSDDEKWSAFTFPVDYDTSLYGSDTKDSQFYMRKNDLKFFLLFPIK